MKLLSLTVALWLACVVGAGLWYVVAGAQWPPIDTEYEQWTDYRLAFFLYAVLPVAVAALAAILWIEWRVLSRPKPPGRLPR
jgi:hypothetical protein